MLMFWRVFTSKAKRILAVEDEDEVISITDILSDNDIYWEVSESEYGYRYEITIPELTLFEFWLIRKMCKRIHIYPAYSFYW